MQQETWNFTESGSRFPILMNLFSWDSVYAAPFSLLIVYHLSATVPPMAFWITRFRILKIWQLLLIICATTNQKHGYNMSCGSIFVWVNQRCSLVYSLDGNAASLPTFWPAAPKCLHLYYASSGLVLDKTEEKALYRCLKKYQWKQLTNAKFLHYESTVADGLSSAHGWD